MKTLKITLLLVAVLLLTVSGVKSENPTSANKQVTDKNYKIDLLAHGKKKIQLPGQG